MHGLDSKNFATDSATLMAESPWKETGLIDGSELPPYFRTVSKIVPISEDIGKSTKIPFGLVMTPGLVDGVALVDLTSSKTVKCSMCSAYLCPWSEVAGDGRAWTCAICGYRGLWLVHEPLIDRVERREQVVDIVDPNAVDSMKRAGPCFAFVFDVSFDAMAGGFTQAAAKFVGEALSGLADETMVCLMTVSHCFTIYDLNKKRQLSYGDFDEISIDSKLSRLGDVRETLSNCILEISDGVAYRKRRGSCYGTSLEALEICLKKTGGVAMVFIYGGTTVGPRTVPVRKESGHDESALLKIPPWESSGFYRNIGYRMAQRSISLHLFAAADTAVDMAIMAAPCSLTGGKCHFYGNYAPRFHHILQADVHRTMSTKYYWDASLKIVMSQGVFLSRTHSNGYMRDRGVVSLGALSPTDAVTFELEIEPHVTKPSVLFQAVLSWKNDQQCRMLRIFTFACGVSEDPSVVLGSVDEGALLAVLVKRSLFNVVSASGSKAGSTFAKDIRCISSLRRAPGLADGILRGPLLRDKYPTGADDHVTMLVDMRAYRIQDIIMYAHPRVISVPTRALKPLTHLLSEEQILVIHRIDVIYIWSASPLPSDGAALSGIIDINTIACDYADDIRAIVEESWKISMRYIHVIAMPGLRHLWPCIGVPAPGR